MKTKTILALATTVTLLSCSETKKDAAKIRSFEISPVNAKDTINIIDSKGRKQGKWLNVSRTGNTVSVTDTLFYVNDSVIKK